MIGNQNNKKRKKRSLWAWKPNDLNRIAKISYSYLYLR